MTHAIYTASIPVFQQMLGGLKEVLRKAEAHATDKKIDPNALLQARLFPDMFPLLRQVQVASDFAKSVSARLAGVDVPKLEDKEETFAELQPYLAALEEEDSKLSVEHQQEAKASLATFAVAISAYEADVGGLDQEFLDEVSPYLPNTPTLAALPLSAEQIQSIGQAIYDRIFLYKLARSRWNQLLVESRALDGHPDQGRILRWLYRELPENGLARYVKTEFERVKEANGTSASSSVETPL